MSIGIKVEGTQEGSVQAVLDGVLAILAADCDENTKVEALHALNRLVLQQVTIRDNSIRMETQKEDAGKEAEHDQG